MTASDIRWLFQDCVSLIVATIGLNLGYCGPTCFFQVALQSLVGSLLISSFHLQRVTRNIFNVKHLRSLFPQHCDSLVSSDRRPGAPTSTHQQLPLAARLLPLTLSATDVLVWRQLTVLSEAWCLPGLRFRVVAAAAAASTRCVFRTIMALSSVSLLNWCEREELHLLATFKHFFNNLPNTAWLIYPSVIELTHARFHVAI